MRPAERNSTVKVAGCTLTTGSCEDYSVLSSLQARVLHQAVWMHCQQKHQSSDLYVSCPERVVNGAWLGSVKYFFQD